MNKLFELTGKIVFISGGSGILGSEMAKSLAAEGASIAVFDRNEESATQLAEQINQGGGKAMVVLGDVLVLETVEKAKDHVLSQWGNIDVLINAAGGNMPGATVAPDGSILDLSLEDIEKVMRLNYLGTVVPSQAVLEVFVEQKKGVIINISSMSAQQPLTRVMGYSSAKAAIDNYTKWLAVEVAQKFGEGIRVNAIAPGFFLTKQNEALLTKPDGSLTERGETIIEHTPLGRFGDPEELIGTLIWLCSDASRFVTGTVIPVDGGFSAFSGV